MFYDKYVELCAMKNVSPTAAAREIGLSKATPTKWKTSGATPSGDNLKKIAAYFGVTESDLLSDESVQLPVRNSEESKRLELREDMRDSMAIRILFDTLEDATDADILEAAATIARRKEERDKR